MCLCARQTCMSGQKTDAFDSGNTDSMSPAAKPLKKSGRTARDKSVSFGLVLSGVGRVSGAPAEWQMCVRAIIRSPYLMPGTHVCSTPSHRSHTYTFSPLSGLILAHNVDSIEPAPHQAVFEALGRFGLVGPYDGVGGGGKPAA